MANNGWVPSFPGMGIPMLRIRRSPYTGSKTSLSLLLRPPPPPNIFIIETPPPPPPPPQAYLVVSALYDLLLTCKSDNNCSSTIHTCYSSLRDILSCCDRELSQKRMVGRVNAYSQVMYTCEWKTGTPLTILLHVTSDFGGYLRWLGLENCFWSQTVQKLINSPRGHVYDCRGSYDKLHLRALYGFHLIPTSISNYVCY